MQQEKIEQFNTSDFFLKKKVFTTHFWIYTKKSCIANVNFRLEYVQFHLSTQNKKKLVQFFFVSVGKYAIYGGIERVPTGSWFYSSDICVCIHPNIDLFLFQLIFLDQYYHTFEILYSFFYSQPHISKFLSNHIISL